MSLPVFYTPRAKETLHAVYAFITQEFGVKAANKFAIKAENTISLISDHPFMFRASTIEEDVRVGVITKQCSLFYKVTADSIHLLFFWDNRQEPLIGSSHSPK